MGPHTTNPYRLLPAVTDVLARQDVAALGARVPRELVTTFVQELLSEWRAAIAAGELDAEGVRARLERDDLLHGLLARVRREEGAGVVPAVNATGIVLHTGLGRAPVHTEAAEAMASAARGYCVLELERFGGERNRRDDRLSVLLQRLTGAEAAIAVNNNAAAVLLALNTFAAGRGTVVSRGELVEIGGSFRMPDVMERAGTRLVEVGTTNRTRIADFRAAVEAPGSAENGSGNGVGLLMKVHTSNFRQVGFTEEVSAAELAALARELGVVAAFDLGSGWLDGTDGVSVPALADEPRVDEAVASGIDLVLFSGDKLLGGPQAGLVVGSASAVGAMRANPMYRALRLDKVALAGLERTLELHLAGRAAEIPARALMGRAAAALEEEARGIAEELARQGYTVRVGAGGSQPGSGSAPGTEIPTSLVRVTRAGTSTAELAARLRAATPPVFARIQDDELLLDPRTLLPGDRASLVAAFAGLAEG